MEIMSPEQIFNSKAFQFGLRNIPNFEQQVITLKEMGIPLSYQQLNEIRRLSIQHKWNIRKEGRSSTVSKGTSNVSDKPQETAALTDRTIDPKRMTNRHVEATLQAKSPGYQKANKPDPFNQDTHSVSEKVRKSTKKHTAKGKSAVKTKTHALVTSKIPTKAMMNKFKGMSPTIKFMIGFGATLGLAYLARSANSIGDIILPTPGVGFHFTWDPKRQYLPTHYQRGYDTIKESLTDFGSRVHLEKTAMKVIAPRPSSTRHARVTDTSSVMRSNMSLSAYNNAIKHTRY